MPDFGITSTLTASHYNIKKVEVVECEALLASCQQHFLV